MYQQSGSNGSVRTRAETHDFDVDAIPANIPDCSHLTKLCLVEDSAAVIQMIDQGRSPNQTHVTRTHRVNLDWLFERIDLDQSLLIKCVRTYDQLADLLTNGTIASQQWQYALQLWQIECAAHDVAPHDTHLHQHFFSNDFRRMAWRNCLTDNSNTFSFGSAHVQPARRTPVPCVKICDFLTNSARTIMNKHTRDQNAPETNSEKRSGVRDLPALLW